MNFLQKVFLLFVLGFLFLGGITAIGVAPFQAPDEGPHWQTGLARSSQFMEPKSGSNCSRASNIFKMFEAERLMFRPHEKIKSGTFDRAVTQPVEVVCSDYVVSYGITLTYFSTLIGSKMLLLPDANAQDLLRNFYLGRILNGLIITLALLRLFFVIKTSRLKWGLFCLLPFLWSPLFVQQSFAISSDNIIILFAISTLILITTIKNIRWGDLLFFVVSGIIAACTKPFVVPVALVPALALIVIRIYFHPFQRPLDWKGVFFKKDFLTIASCFGIVCSGFAYYLLTGGASVIEHPPGVDSAKQMALIIENPLRALAILNRSIENSFNLGAFYSAMGYVDTNPPAGFGRVWRRIFYFAATAELIFIAYSLLNILFTRDRKRIGLALTMILGTFLLLYAGALGNCLALFLTFTPVGLDFVAGMQQRYFFHTFMVSLACPIMLYHFSKDIPNRVSSFSARLYERFKKPFDLLSNAALAAIFFQFAMLASLVSLTWLIRYW